MNAKKELIRFENVSIGYQKQVVVQNINLSVFENDFIGVVGPNGSGKTTLLKTMLGSLKPASGVINKQKLVFGYVPQRDIVNPLLPWSVFDVVVMGRYQFTGLFKNPGKRDFEIVDECLNLTGIYHLKNSNYNNLSGGERQRTLIARALAAKPDILVLDEPTNGMDTPSHYQLISLIEELHGKKGLTILLVSHLLSDVANIAKQIILLDNNKIQSGPIEEILSEENLAKTYNSEFRINKTNGRIIITPNRR